MNKRSYRESEAAEYLGVSRGFLAQSRMKNKRPGSADGPRWITLGNRFVRYLKDDLDSWLESARPSH